MNKINSQVKAPKPNMKRKTHALSIKKNLKPHLSQNRDIYIFVIIINSKHLVGLTILTENYVKLLTKLKRKINCNRFCS